MERRFKEGDIVRLVDSYGIGGGHKVGTHARVTGYSSADGDCAQFMYLDWQDGSPQLGCYREHRFELATPEPKPKFKVGDIVVLTNPERKRNMLAELGARARVMAYPTNSKSWPELGPRENGVDVKWLGSEQSNGAYYTDSFTLEQSSPSQVTRPEAPSLEFHFAFTRPELRCPTLCLLTWQGTLYKGWSFCNPEDTFDALVGRKHALVDALRRAGLGLEERRQVWNQFLEGRGI